MVHFSWFQLGAFLAVGILALLLIVWAVSRVAAVVPSALEKRGYPSGVGGLLLLVVVFMWLMAVSPLFRLGREGAEAVRVAFMDSAYTWAALSTLIPDLVSALLLTIAAFMLTAGRSPRALYGAVLLGWLGGPCGAFLRSYFLNISLTITGEPSALVVAMFVASLYLLFSARSQLTYALPAAYQLPERG